MKLVLACVLSVITFANPSAVRANDLTIALHGNCPGRMALDWQGATPDRYAMLAFGTHEGQTTLPSGPCAGTVIGLIGNVRGVTPPFRTGSSGEGMRFGHASSGSCGGFVQLVVAAQNGCSTSNVVQIPQ